MAHDIMPHDNDSPSPAAPARPKATAWRSLGYTLALLLAIALLWLTWSATRVALAGAAAYQDVRRVQHLAADLSPSALPALTEDVAYLDAHLATVQSAGRPFWWLAARLGWLPRIGTEVQALPAMVNMAAALASGGHQALDALAPVTEALSAEWKGDLLARTVPALAVSAPRLAAVRGKVAEAQAARDQIVGPLHPRLEALLAKVDRALALAGPGLELVQMAPELLGANGPRTYLLLAQNNDELRATGGFITGVGVLRLENGRITQLRLTDSYAADNLQQPHPTAPQVLFEQMGAQMLLLRDSNWSPDFPTSAQVARSIYQQDQGVATDGALAIDMEAVRLLVGAVGPVSLSGQDEPITGDNVIVQMKRSWENANDGQGTGVTDEWWLKRKDFMGPLMMASLARLQSGSNVSPAALGLALFEMLDGRHVQIAVDDPQTAAQLERQGWDGALRPPKQGDYLAIIDSNLGFNKTNAAIRQRIDYQADRATGSETGLEATLTITYTHTATQLSGPCDRAPRYGKTYDDMINRCYWDYLRVYVPAGATLKSAEGLQETTTGLGENNTTVFAGNLMLQPGQTQRVMLRYQLPAPQDAQPYRLAVRVQGGTLAPPLHVQAGPCRWDTDLARDRAFACDRWTP